MESPFRNLLLDRFYHCDREALANLPVVADLATDLPVEGERARHVVFPDTAVLQENESSERHGDLSVALVGSEGMVGLSALMGVRRSRTTSHVLVPGSGYRIEADRLNALVSARPAMQALVLLYAHYRMTDLARSAHSAGRSRIDNRVSRCLLMMRDRLGHDRVPVTHESLAVVLGVRRPGVTDALHRLEGLHLIKSTRGIVTIRDRAGLMACAGDTYGLPESEYRRLIDDAAFDNTGPELYANGARTEGARPQMAV